MILPLRSVFLILIIVAKLPVIPTGLVITEDNIISDSTIGSDFFWKGCTPHDRAETSLLTTDALDGHSARAADKEDGWKKSVTNLRQWYLITDGQAADYNLMDSTPNAANLDDYALS
ncbi:hypothetical protein Scep_019274 [Stephania cephalantha]|uniref:Uncharacterized protein n=1 Tax=Stephania cephalantha TaxID=152367 RepID=A0AAP0IAL8_9MAGN